MVLAANTLATAITDPIERSIPPEITTDGLRRSGEGEGQCSHGQRLQVEIGELRMNGHSDRERGDEQGRHKEQAGVAPERAPEPRCRRVFDAAAGPP